MRINRSLFAGMAAAAAFLLPGTAQAQLFFTDPAFASGVTEPGDPVIGEPLPGANPAEQRASLMWNLRSGLNVAALRCQFSKYLRTVDVYNAVIAHHDDELTAAYNALGGYFRRVHGPREGQRRFDQWVTLTYNKFSTENTRGFCQVASNIGKDALTRPKGAFFELARERMRELRNSALPYVDRIFPPVSTLPPLPATLFTAPPADPCAGLSGRPLQQCRREAR